jgi:hypothetical protein
VDECVEQEPVANHKVSCRSAAPDCYTTVKAAAVLGESFSLAPHPVARTASTAGRASSRKSLDCHGAVQAR